MRTRFIRFVRPAARSMLRPACWIVMAAAVLVARPDVIILPAHADTVSANFTILGTSTVPSDGTITLTLNGDGTIAASLSVLSGRGPIIAFGIDTKTTFSQSNFSFAPHDTNIWGNFYGQDNTAFNCTTDCGFSESWTIGTASQFTSVLQALNGGSLSSHAFVVLTSPASHVVYQLAADPVVTPIPPTLPLFAAGLGVFGFVARRRRKAAPAV